MNFNRLHSELQIAVGEIASDIYLKKGIRLHFDLSACEKHRLCTLKRKQGVRSRTPRENCRKTLQTRRV
jgi:hypothetical protein